MIRRAVLSYFNADESFGNKCGFNSYRDFLYCTALSIICASKHFKEVQFISTDHGVRVFRDIKVPVTHYSNSLNQMKSVSRFFWAYGKLIAYTEQTQPFLHLDNDVLLNNKLPDKILNARLCFQSHEPFNLPGYHYYNLLRKAFEAAPVKPKIIEDNPVMDFAYNCGICGGYDLEFFKEWRKASEEYIFAKENEKVFFRDFIQILIHQNLYHEQYFAASLIKAHNLRSEVRVLNPDVVLLGKDKKLKYSHLWGTTKKNRGNMAMVELRLMRENKALYDRINAFCKENNVT